MFYVAVSYRNLSLLGNSWAYVGLRISMGLPSVYSTWYCCASVGMCELLDLAIDACASSWDARNTTEFLCDEYRLIRL